MDILNHICRPLTPSSRFPRRERRKLVPGHNSQPYTSFYFPWQSNCLQHHDLCRTSLVLLLGKCSWIFRKLSSSHLLSGVFPEHWLHHLPWQYSPSNPCCLAPSVPSCVSLFTALPPWDPFWSLLSSKLCYALESLQEIPLNEWMTGDRTGSEGKTDYQTTENWGNWPPRLGRRWQPALCEISLLWNTWRTSKRRGGERWGEGIRGGGFTKKVDRRREGARKVKKSWARAFNRSSRGA